MGHSAEERDLTKIESGVNLKPAAKAEPVEDVALICGRSKDGKGLQVVRKRDDRVEAAVLKPLEEGKPIAGEVLQLKPRGDSPVCDVEVLLPATASAQVSSTDIKKPAQVASDVYRKNYDSIYGRGSRASGAGAPDKKLLN